ncbi:MAG: carboxypeptidase regulatory-like domain-containing protein, partial [Desulfuromonadales bacterium]|nr:carboxypeptidase regulatory-like domain-containing protein [Desulfuromonadales bacterium]
MVFSLYACGSSGGGGGAVAPLSLSGVVTDSDREPVGGASVTLYDDTGGAVATVTADAAGRYGFRGIANGTYTLQADGGVGTFPSEMGDITLSGVVPTV